MSFVDMSQTGNDAQDNRYCVTRFAFRGFRRAALPIASVTALRVLWKEMPAVMDKAFYRAAVDSGRVGGASVYSTLISNIERSQAARNSSSKERVREEDDYTFMRLTQIKF